MQELETANRGTGERGRKFAELFHPPCHSGTSDDTNLAFTFRREVAGGDGGGERSEFSSLRQSSEETHQPRGHPGLAARSRNYVVDIMQIRDYRREISAVFR